MSLRLAISNIAWDPAEDDDVAARMRSAGFTGVEIAPTKRWANPLLATTTEISALERAWAGRSAPIVAMQALLFGRNDLVIFGDEAARRATANYLKKICQLGGQLGAKALVFGSPKNRARGKVPPGEAREIAISFFREVGQVAAAAGTCLCIEANPPQYGCDFITTSVEALELVRAVDTPGFGLHLDVAGMFMAGEDVVSRIQASSGHIRHFHLSAPNLAHVAASAPIDYRAALRALEDTGYTGWISVEMRAAEERSQNLARIAETLEFVSTIAAHR